MALMCAVMFLSLVVTEAHAQRRGGGNDDEWRRRRGNGDSRSDRGRGNTGRDRGNNGRDRRDVGRDRRDDDRGRRDVGRDRRDDRRPDDRDWRNPRNPNQPRNPGRDVRRDDSRRPNRDVVRRDRHDRYRHRPNWNRPGHRYTRYTHRPNRTRVDHRRRFARRYDYHRTIPYRYVYWDTWIRYRVSFNDGYILVDGYPYYVYNGYRHRYSSYDYCDYDLVDGYDNRVEHTFYGYTCAQAYDLCADIRDDLNYRRSDYRYFCSERLDFTYGSYTHWSYDDDFYYDVY